MATQLPQPEGAPELLTKDELANVCPALAKAGRVDEYLPFINAALEEFAINTPVRIAAWLAQMAHESIEMMALHENMNYSAERLRQVFPKYFPTAARAQLYAHKPEAIANLVYANRYGNGGPETGDGWRFRGAGITHLTFRDNFREFGAALGVDLVAQPELAADPTVMFRIAARYWATRGCNTLADAGSFETITRRINGGLNGQSSRLVYWARAKKALGVAA